MNNTVFVNLKASTNEEALSWMTEWGNWSAYKAPIRITNPHATPQQITDAVYRLLYAKMPLCSPKILKIENGFVYYATYYSIGD